MSAASDPSARLVAAAAALGIELGVRQQEQLLAYLELIAKWNKVYNLTAVRDPDEMLVQHLFDSLAAVPALRRQTGGRAVRLLDVGSGAGLPGVVIAVCCPEIHVDCVDTVGKKAAFIQQVAVQLRLPNLRGLHDRVEQLAGPYEVVSSRAFASLADFVTWSEGALAAGGVWLAMKGKRPDAELAALPPAAEAFHVEQLIVPELSAERCIVWMRRRIEPGSPAAGS
ncbi:16S rRNA (guanine(527)-N(7))-methyltransferase RsmG [Ramlibacter ginsenosidimutans]|uniref:Ribosomal RNA small subunit methyltransferase G n=1 Tax=Ramlibacter ginsenosidimutans TaxID=502333 RepID=A0A934TRT3_9BURK|nr:16S rRNA (guanine(527)-N(7))-methyltransferase RsmG [Ramlibacter ginsenosidimutans]MBK6005557.1 16S rRNA (guanine(527)-N(7))-methyltransferase RsmG [Ramlibacter ginsenosidimutans]